MQTSSISRNGRALRPVEFVHLLLSKLGKGRRIQEVINLQMAGLKTKKRSEVKRVIRRGHSCESRKVASFARDLLSRTPFLQGCYVVT